MKFIEWLNDRISIALWLIGAVALIISFIEAYKNWEALKEIFFKLKRQILRLLNKGKTSRRRHYNKVVSSQDYLDWQKEILKCIYDPVIDEYNRGRSDNYKCTYANAFDYEYEAVYFRSKEIDYPFKEIEYKKRLGDFPLKVKDKGGKIKVEYGKPTKLAKRYYRLMKPTIGFPNNIGYMLDKMEIDETRFGFAAHPNTYLSNVYTSNILEYELYLLYRKLYKKRHKKVNKIVRTTDKSCNNKKGTLYLGSDAKDFLLKLLPIRAAIHDKYKDNETSILTEGAGRESLLGVQAMILCKNQVKGYDVLRIRRSEYVDAKASFLQFIPSGGFSALNNGISHDIITSNFSISKAILREFLEECFGEEDFSGRKNISTENIYSDPILEKLNLLKNTRNMEFIGDAFSLVDLRHELSFIIKIDDFEVINKIRNNEECANVIDFISIEKLEDVATWEYSFATKQYSDYKMLNPTSAALWNLAQGTELYSQCKSSDN